MALGVFSMSHDRGTGPSGSPADGNLPLPVWPGPAGDLEYAKADKARPRRNRLAAVSLTGAVLAFVLLIASSPATAEIMTASLSLALMAIALGVTGLIQISRHGGRGRGMAIAGIVIGLLYLIFLVLLLIALASALSTLSLGGVAGFGGGSHR